MSGDDRNEICSCGKINPKTGMPLKKKNCYDKPEFENTCLLFLQNNREKYVQLFQKYMDEIISEVIEALLLISPKNELVRVKFILIFSMLDVLINFWKIFNSIETDHETSISDRSAWKNWFKNFIFIQDNSEWFKWKERNFYDGFKEFDGADFYDIRSSLVHFFGLGENSHLCLVSFSSEDTKIIFRKIGAVEMDARELSLIVQSGCLLMIDAINQQINSDGRNLIKLRSLYKEIEKKGANKLEYNDFKKT